MIKTVGKNSSMSCCCGGNQNMCGGTQPAPVDPEVTTLVNSLRPEVESKMGQNFTSFNPIQVLQQVVAGMNYFVRVDIGNPQQFLDLRIFHQAWTNTTELSSFKMSPSTTPLAFFD
ncbi:hypothetical protein GEMRC1_007458 [Eukaryota sp. GEM-RC1]